MRGSLSGCLLVLLAVLDAGCTFYTSCPAAGTTDPGGNGGMGGSGPQPTGTWVNVTTDLAGIDSECGNMSFVSAKPDEDLLIAGVALQGLWGSRDGGQSWQPLGTGRGTDDITNRTSSILYDPVDTQTYWESGLYNGPGVYLTVNNGRTYRALGGTMSVDFVSVDFQDPDRKTLLASGHETPHVLSLSVDGGATWEAIGDNIPDEAQVCPFPLIIDERTFLLGCDNYAGGTPGVFRSTDAGQSWRRVSDLGGGSAPLIASDGTIYWASPGQAGLTKSNDKGKTWSTALGKGSISINSTSAGLVELPDGRIVAFSDQGLVASGDGGQTFVRVTSKFPIAANGFTYSVQQKAFYSWYFTCSGASPVPDDAIQRYAFDYEKE